MRRVVTALALLLLAAPLAAQQTQEMSLTEATKLFEKPDPLSSVQATLPVGLKVTVLTEQDGWIAVSVSEDVAGWIMVNPVTRSAPVARTTSATPPPSTSANASPPPPPTTRSAPPPAESSPPPPPPSLGSTSASGPPPPPTGVTSSTPPPPPPGGSAPPPPRRTESSDLERTGDSQGGFYDVHSWSRFHYDTQEDVQALGLQYGVMMTDVGEFEANLIGARTSGRDDIYSLDLTLRYNLYFLQPSDDLPVGVYGAALGAFQHYFPPSGEEEIDLFAFEEPAGPMPALSSSCVCGINENVARAGGEGGVFLRVAVNDKLTIIPRAAYRYQRNFVIGEDSGESYGLTTIVAGADFMFGRVAPGLFLQRLQLQDAGEAVNLISLGLALPFGR